MNVGPLCVEPLVGVCGVVDNFELAVSVEEAVAALHVAFVVALLVAEGPVVTAKRGKRIAEINKWSLNRGLGQTQ